MSATTQTTGTTTTGGQAPIPAPATGQAGNVGGAHPAGPVAQPGGGGGGQGGHGGGGGGAGGGGGGGGGNPGGAQQAAAPNPPQLPAPILISPWHGEIDLNTKAGKMLWEEGIKPLENKFTGYGKDLARFLADIKNRADKCQWMPILTFNGMSLLKRYGEIPRADVEAARDIRQAVQPTTLQQARPIMNALMMFHFLYDSLGSVPQKKLSTRLEGIRQDGPLLLKIVLDLTFVATQAATFTIKEKFYDLNLKKYKWNVHVMNQDVREKMADLEAAGHASDQTDVIISLFRAYNTATSDEFKGSVTFWKNEWNAGTWDDVEALMMRADSKYSELKDLGVWGKRSTKDDQIIALTNKITSLQKKTKSGGDKKNESNNPKWKYDRTLSKSSKLQRNDKTYHWCDGPGHNKIGMWVIHKPGTCTNNSKSSSDNSDSRTVQTSNTSTSVNKQALTSMLQSTGASDAEVQSKVQAIMAVMSS